MTSQIEGVWRVLCALEDTAFAAEFFERAFDGDTFAHDVGIDHRRADILVAEEFLYRPDVGAAFEQVRGKAVAEGMARRWFDDASLFYRLSYCSADG